MRVFSLRLVGSLVFLLAAAGPLAAEETMLQGTWALDVKASKNVPEAQKGVDLRIAIRDNHLTISRFVGEKSLGEPMVLFVDGTSRPQEVGGQRATVVVKWLEKDRKFEHVITMMQPGSVFATTQTIVTEVSPSGTTMTRKYVVRQARDTQERLLVYRRK
ncbi:MAG: hypothetical protein KJ062_06660 [Thermoanaerobaculia bacterium]|nr:hypothetical protein [Thermoanaerobaculia bacterium]